MELKSSNRMNSLAIDPFLHVLPQHLIKSDSFGWFVHEHVLDQVKQILVVVTVTLLVVL